MPAGSSCLTPPDRAGPRRAQHRVDRLAPPPAREPRSLEHEQSPERRRAGRDPRLHLPLPSAPGTRVPDRTESSRLERDLAPSRVSDRLKSAVPHSEHSRENPGPSVPGREVGVRTTTSVIARTLCAVALVWAALGCAAFSSSWEDTKQANTVAAYSRYLRDNPNSEHAQEAEERIAALRTLAHQTVESYEKFVEPYPSSALLPEMHKAMEPLYFARARGTNTPQSYQTFLSQYPDGELARRAAGDLAYAQMTDTQPSVATLREFMRQYPESDFATDAQRSLDLVAFKRETAIRHLGIRVEVSPNTAQPQRVRRGFVAVVAKEYRLHGVDVTFIPSGAEPTPEMDGWLRLDYEESPAPGTFGGSTMLSRCRVRLYHKSSPKDAIWDRTFEATAEHILKGTY